MDIKFNRKPKKLAKEEFEILSSNISGIRTADSLCNLAYYMNRRVEGGYKYDKDRYDEIKTQILDQNLTLFKRKESCTEDNVAKFILSSLQIYSFLEDDFRSKSKDISLELNYQAVLKFPELEDRAIRTAGGYMGRGDYAKAEKIYDNVYDRYQSQNKTLPPKIYTKYIGVVNAGIDQSSEKSFKKQINKFFEILVDLNNKGVISSRNTEKKADDISRFYENQKDFGKGKKIYDILDSKFKEIDVQLSDNAYFRYMHLTHNAIKKNDGVIELSSKINEALDIVSKWAPKTTRLNQVSFYLRDLPRRLLSVMEYESCSKACEKSFKIFKDNKISVPSDLYRMYADSTYHITDWSKKSNKDIMFFERVFEVFSERLSTYPDDHQAQKAIEIFSYNFVKAVDNYETGKGFLEKAYNLMEKLGIIPTEEFLLRFSSTYFQLALKSENSEEILNLLIQAESIAKDASDIYNESRDAKAGYSARARNRSEAEESNDPVRYIKELLLRRKFNNEENQFKGPFR